jgi:UDP-2-acetamido-3-amino-2,3-dideoxy-glucuronate N-acetyltransferase
MIVFDDTKPWSEKLIVFRECFKWGVDKTVIPSLASRGFEVVEEKEPLQNECLHFLKACAERSNPKTNGDEGIGVLRLLTAAQSSLELGGVTVRIDN